MNKEIIKTIPFGKDSLVLRTGKIAKQAQGAVVASMGQTMVLCTVTVNSELKKDIDFFPLSVQYKESFYAAGKIPGGYIKREGKSSDKEVIISRLIDRPIRPLFQKDFFHETQIICSVLSFDPLHTTDIISMIGASAALAISGLPYEEIMAAARVGFIDNQLILNPSYEQLKKSTLDMIVAGSNDSIIMVESEASELPESKMLEALEFAHNSFKPVIRAIEEFAKEASKEAFVFKTTQGENPLYTSLKNEFLTPLVNAYKIFSKKDRNKVIQELKNQALEKHKSDDKYSVLDIERTLFKLQSEIVRNRLINEKIRIDGRGLKDIRPIECEVGLLPKTHGSALFTRGETQALVITTLGTAEDQQSIDSLEGEFKESFMLHYNFPSYSVGEVGIFKGPGRREIGHGTLAKRALASQVPARSAFPYTIRVVSEITESNGSSSMASVCGASLALMDAGVPMKSPVAGIAMGLIKEENNYVILSDILGDEDYLGDMDFKVAGTAQGITALQMDIKITGITMEVMQLSLEQAREGRMHILGKMNKALESHRLELNENAPSMKEIKINKDKIRDLIGPGGKNIKDICEKTNAKIDISDDGTVKIAASNSEDIALAIQLVNACTATSEVGQIYEGTVVKVIESGAFINIGGAQEGFLHISEVSENRIANIREHLHENDKVKVKVIGFDNKNKVKLSIKKLAPEKEVVDIPVVEEKVEEKSDSKRIRIKPLGEKVSKDSDFVSERKYFN